MLEALAPYLIMGGSQLLSSLLNNKGSSQSVSQQPLYSPEQQEAMQKMLNIYKNSGGYNFGAP